METPPRAPSSADSDAWIDAAIAPPHVEGIRKLLAVLGTVEDASAYLTRVKRHLVDGPLRTELGIALYDETVWGVIRWERSLGKPATPTLSEGFGIMHQFDLSFDAGGDPESSRTIGGWVDAGKPTVWDGPNDDETYAVSFMLRGIVKWNNRVIVGFAIGTDWQSDDEPWMTRRMRYITYPEGLSLSRGEFKVSKGDVPKDLGMFEVVPASLTTNAEISLKAFGGL